MREQDKNANSINKVKTLRVEQGNYNIVTNNMPDNTDKTDYINKPYLTYNNKQEFFSWQDVRYRDRHNWYICVDDKDLIIKIPHTKAELLIG